MSDDTFGYSGEEYRRMRIENNLSQYEVARSVGISRHSLSNYEYGKVDMPLTVSLRLNNYYKKLMEKKRI